MPPRIALRAEGIVQEEERVLVQPLKTQGLDGVEHQRARFPALSGAEEVAGETVLEPRVPLDRRRQEADHSLVDDTDETGG